MSTIFFDFQSSSGQVHTFYPLNVFDRAEFYQRLLQFEEKRKNPQLYAHNLAAIFDLFGYQISKFSTDDIAKLLINPGYLIGLCFSYQGGDKKQSVKEKIIQVAEKNTPDMPGSRSRHSFEVKEQEISPYKNLIQSILSAWNVCNSASEALLLLRNVPADLALEVLNERGETLEKAYETSESKKASLKRDAVNKMKQELQFINQHSSLR